MGIQVTIILDSGAFMTDEDNQGALYTEVGYFTPDIKFYGDGRIVKELDPGRLGTSSRVVDIILKKPDGSAESGINLSEGFCSHMLRLHKLHGRFVHVDRDMFDCVFKFNSGHLRCSKVKARDFKEMNGRTNELSGRKHIPPIAHDVAIHYEIEDGGELVFNSNGKQTWSSKDHPDIKKRFDIEIMADHTTADMYFNQCLKLRGQNYWLPNQGDPPPYWSHSTPEDGDPGVH